VICELQRWTNELPILEPTSGWDADRGSRTSVIKPDSIGHPADHRKNSRRLLDS
jgi:hypothetical protein